MLAYTVPVKLFQYARNPVHADFHFSQHSAKRPKQNPYPNRNNIINLTCENLYLKSMNTVIMAEGRNKVLSKREQQFCEEHLAQNSYI